MTEPVSPSNLLEHAAFVRRLASRLLGDGPDADDAAQETLARSVERPPSPRAGGVRPWLATVLRNLIRSDRRSARRRASRERAAARPDGAMSAADLVARGEILRVVVEAVHALDAPSREVVLLRHYEDLPPRAIAARLSLPVETVRSRLRRAYERLAAHLDESDGGNVERWRSALGALVGGGEAERRLHAPSAAIGGALIMGTATKLGVGVAVALVVGGGLLFVVRDRGAPERSGDRAPERVESAQTVGGPVDAPPNLAAPPTRTERPAPTASATLTIDGVTYSTDRARLARPTRRVKVSGQVIGLQGAVPEGATAYVIDRNRGEAPVGHVPIATDGTFALEVEADAHYDPWRPIVGAWLRNRKRVEVETESQGGAPIRVVLESTEGQSLSGLVVDAQNRPLTGFAFALVVNGPRQEAGASAAGDLSALLTGTIAPMLTDDAGRFTASGLDDSTTTEYFGVARDPTLWMEAADRQRSRQGRSDVVLRVLPAYRVTLRLVPTSADDDPRTWGQNSVMYELRSASASTRTLRSGGTGSTTSISLSGPRRDVSESLEWTLRLEVRGHKPVERGLVLPSGATVADLDIAVERLGASESGRAVIETPFRWGDGKAAKPEVRVAHGFSMGRFWEPLNANLRPDGTWDVTLPAGPATLVVRAATALGGEFSCETETLIVSGADARPTLRFPPHGSVKFRTSPSPTKDGWIKIQYRRASDSANQPGGLEFRRGEAFVSAMPEGQWEVSCEVDGNDRHARFPVTAGTETQVELVPGK